MFPLYIFGKVKTFLFFPIFSSNETPCLKRLLRTSIVKNTFCLCINYKFGKIGGKYGTVQKKMTSFVLQSFFGTVFFTESKGVMLVLVQD